MTGGIPGGVMKAVYPGSFDPVTNGHLDIIERGSRLFDHLTVAVAHNLSKVATFEVDERVQLLRELIGGKYANVQVESFEGLVVEYAAKNGMASILRGLRTFSDFEYEFQMALTNRSFDESVETIFIMPSLKYAYISSRLLKESVAMGANVGHMVPAIVERRLKNKLRPSR